ncbi:hypothetical protein [Halobacteriovorax sp. HLS]|uniref:hypothetical protein n=1 Tax=Halobacteriovorax sp. HLS TaxID=2234000 RepID=UPI000FD6FAB4|nr:hypothetical protein [Halobacteriovorax sp. HLS]
MKYLLIIIFIFFEASVLASTILSTTDKSKDMAIFKIEEQVYYLSDINESLKDLSVFRCLDQKSLLLTSLKISKREYEEFNSFLPDYSALGRRQEQLEKLMILHKMLLYSVPISINVSQDNLNSIGFSKCNKSTKLSNTMKLMIKSEFHLRDRFIRNRDSFTIDENLLEKLRIFYSGIDRKLRGQVYFQ